MAEALTPIEIFCSYAHEDEIWLQKLQKHLSLLKQQGLVSLWHDRLITPGADWAKTIDTHLETASVILLLVSANFFASDYCYGIEMKRALERETSGEARVVPILVRPVDWKEAPFAHLQALPTDAKPVASWRDADLALTDVAAGIRRVIEEVPLLAASASRGALPSIWNIPYPRNPFFLGRDDELAQLRAHLHAGQVTALSQPQAISGLGGIGKTQLALEYAYRYHQEYQIVLWARAESTEALVSSFVAIASLLRLPEREAKEQDITVQAVKTWLQTHRGWLLILDNADELTLLPGYLPPTLGGHLLLTTRAAAMGRLAQRLEIETLHPEQGALLLLRRAGLLDPSATLEQASLEEQALARKISEEVGGLPLALDQAGAYLEETGIDLESYWQLYEQHRADLLAERGGLVADHPAPVATTWSLSFQRIQEKNPAAADLLRLCAYCSADAIPEEIVTMGASTLGSLLSPVAADAFLLNQAIEALRAYSLVRRDHQGKSLSLHRLVQAVIRDQLSEMERRRWTERVVLAVNATFPRPVHNIWPQCERLVPHVLLYANVAADQAYEKDLVELLKKTADYLYQRAQYKQAEPLYLRVIQIQEQRLGAEHPDVGTLFHDLAKLYREQEKYEQAELLYQRAIRIQEQGLGNEHLYVATSLTNLALLYADQGMYEQAEPLYQRALQIRQQALGADHIQVANALVNLALLYHEQGKYEQAEMLYQRTIQIFEQGLEAGHPSLGYPLLNLANLYAEQGKYQLAKLLYQRALWIWEQKLGTEHPQVAFALSNLAILHSDQREYEQAEPLYQRALRIRERALGTEHSYVASSLLGLANLYRDQALYEQAEPLYQRTLRIRERALGSQHPETAEAMHDLARLREAQGNREEAKALYSRALTVREQTLGVHHPKTTETRTHLISLFQTMGQHEEATQLEATRPES